jgi:hypothetical protein
MTTLTTMSAVPEVVAADSAADSAVPVAHDFPFLTCIGCGFPIPPWDLAGDDYRHWHASTCAGYASQPAGVGSGRAAALGAAVETPAVAGVGGLPTVPPLGVKGASHPLRGRPRAAALDPEPLAARRVAVGAGTACPSKRPPRAKGPRAMTNRQHRQARRATTHELYLHAVRDVVVTRATKRGAITAEQAERLARTKLLYGIGDGTYRGVTVYGAWHNGSTDSGYDADSCGCVDIVEVAATGQESWVQLAGTVIHELAHVLAGHAAGHSTAWKDTAVALGFTMRPAAAGQVYHLAMIEPTVRHAVHSLAERIGDGRPEFSAIAIPAAPTTPRPCSAGIGTKGGSSRGKGSGSRMRLWQCGCAKPVKVRGASDDFRATCDHCGTAFRRADQPTKREPALGTVGAGVDGRGVGAGEWLPLVEGRRP